MPFLENVFYLSLFTKSIRDFFSLAQWGNKGTFRNIPSWWTAHYRKPRFPCRYCLHRQENKYYIIDIAIIDRIIVQLTEKNQFSFVVAQCLPIPACRNTISTSLSWSLSSSPILVLPRLANGKGSSSSTLAATQEYTCTSFNSRVYIHGRHGRIFMVGVDARSNWVLV